MNRRTIIIAPLFVLGVVGTVATSPADEAACSYYELDDECRERCDDVVTTLQTPRTHTAALVGVCLTRGDEDVNNARCGCFVEVPAAGADADLGDDDVLLGEVRGIVGDALGPRGERCILGDDGACSNLCAQLEEDRVVDDNRTDARLIDTRCEVTCGCAVEFDDECRSYGFFVDELDVDAGSDLQLSRGAGDAAACETVAP